MGAKTNTAGKLIKRSREAKGWTQEELAQRIGFKNKSTIARIENGSLKVTARKVAQFAKVLEIEADDLTNAVLYDRQSRVINNLIDDFDTPSPTFEDLGVAESGTISDEEIIKSRNYLVHFFGDGRAEMVLQDEIEPSARHLLKYLKLLSEESKLELLKRAEELHLLEEMKKKKEDEKK